MKKNLAIVIGLTALLFAAFAAFAASAYARTRGTPTLVDTVRAATQQYRDASVAQHDGYGLFYGCINGPDAGAMGVHLVKGDLVGDGVVDASHPEALLYEPRNGEFRLTGVEYVVLAADWDAAHDGPPILGGQVFNYVGSPNRYRIPAFYALHVWAWKDNPNGTFVDWNPRVSCDDYTGGVPTP